MLKWFEHTKKTNRASCCVSSFEKQKQWIQHPSRCMSTTKIRQLQWTIRWERCIQLAKSKWFSTKWVLLLIHFTVMAFCGPMTAKRAKVLQKPFTIVCISIGCGENCWINGYSWQSCVDLMKMNYVQWWTKWRIIMKSYMVFDLCRRWAHKGEL